MAFVGLVWLYACRVKRLRTEKRKPIYFSALAALAAISIVVIALLLCFMCFALVVFASLLFFVGLSWVVGSFSLWMIATKRKGKLLGLSSLRSWFVVIRLLIVRGLPAIPFRLLRGSVRNCSNVGGLRHNTGNLLR